MKRKEEKYLVDQLKEIATEALEIEPQSIANIAPLGGMTNKNYRLRLTDGREYVMRIPGAGTEDMIDRENEGKNLRAITKLGIDAKIVYFNERNGVKISEMIPDAENFDAKNGALGKAICGLLFRFLKKLHNSNVQNGKSF